MANSWTTWVVTQDDPPVAILACAKCGARKCRRDLGLDDAETKARLDGAYKVFDQDHTHIVKVEIDSATDDAKRKHRKKAKA